MIIETADLRRLLNEWQRSEMTARRLLGKSCTGAGAGALSAAASCRVSRLWLNPRRLIFPQKYRGSAKGREAEEQRRGVAGVERGENIPLPSNSTRRHWISGSIGAAFTMSRSLRCNNEWDVPT